MTDAEIRELELASRGVRFWAAVLDILLILLATGVVLWVTGLLETAEAFRSDLGTKLRVLTAGTIAYALLNAWLLLKRGQTVGKLVCSIGIVQADSEQRPAIVFLVLRSILNPLVIFFGFDALLLEDYSFGWLLMIVDSCFIFSKKRRCLHDYLCQTRIVKYS